MKNTLVNPEIKLEGKKIWNDANDQDGIRPDEVTIKLFANGIDTGKTTKATKLGNWEYKFENLAKYDANGDEIVYSVVEIGVPGYTAEINGTTITNTHTPVVPPTPVKPNGGNDPGKNGGKKGGKPNTFDEGGMALYSVMAGLSGLLFIAVSKKRKYSR